MSPAASTICPTSAPPRGSPCVARLTRMRYPAALLTALVSSAGLVLGAVPATASPLKPASCITVFDLPGAACGTLTVPLDRSGAVPGTVKLFVERDRVRGGDKNATVAVFPGGPGAATSVYGASFLGDLGKA